MRFIDFPLSSLFVGKLWQQKYILFFLPRSVIIPELQSLILLDIESLSMQKSQNLTLFPYSIKKKQ
jgi:hypothetical protein